MGRHAKAFRLLVRRPAFAAFLESARPGDDTGDVNAARPLTERSLEELLWTTLASRSDGLVVLRDRDGMRHGVWVQGGFVVGVHVAGRFDPLLDVLRREGALNGHAYASCVRALWRPDVRSGSLATEIAGVERSVVRNALRRQILERMAALLRSPMPTATTRVLKLKRCLPGRNQPAHALGALLRGMQRQGVVPAPVRPPNRGPIGSATTAEGARQGAPPRLSRPPGPGSPTFARAGAGRRDRGLPRTGPRRLNLRAGPKSRTHSGATLRQRKGFRRSTLVALSPVRL